MSITIPTARSSARTPRVDVTPSWPLAADTIAVIQLDEAAPPGRLATELENRDRPWQVVHRYRGEVLPDPDRILLVILLGSTTAPADDPRLASWVRELAERNRSVVAVGSSAHLLARELGGPPAADSPGRHGWTYVRSHAEELITSGSWFTWGGRALSPPADAEVLASSAGGAHAFRLGRHLGLTFHPEVTDETISGWLLSSEAPVLDTQGILEAGAREARASAVASQRLWRNLLNDLAPEG